MTVAEFEKALASLRNDEANLKATLNACLGAIQQTMYYIEQERQREALLPVAPVDNVLPFAAKEAE